MNRFSMAAAMAVAALGAGVAQAHVGAGANVLSFGRFQNAEGFAAALA
jgi:hypothetical protein